MKDYSVLIADKKHREKFVERLQTLMSEYMSTNNFSNIDEACDNIGISHQSYYDYISFKKKNKGYTYPGYDALYKLATEFTVSSDYLLCLSDEDKTSEAKEIDLTYKDICNKTGLSENVVYQLCYDFTPFRNRQPIIDFFYETSEEMLHLLKKHSATKSEKVKKDIAVKIQECMLKDYQEENIYSLKRLFLNNIYFYVFEKVKNVDYFDSNEGDFKPLERVYLTNEYSDENGIVGNTYDITTALFDKFYLDTANENLTDIKKDFQKNHYEKYHSKFKKFSSNFTALKNTMKAQADNMKNKK